MVRKRENLSDSQLTLRLLGLIATNSKEAVQERVKLLNKHGLNANECARALGISSGDASSYILRKSGKRTKKKKG